MEKKTIFDCRVVKIEKGVFFVEYKEGRWSDWEQVEKSFKTSTKAENYLAEHFIIKNF